MIGIIDYGLGNLSAILNVYHRLNIKAHAVSEIGALDDFSHLILPGVGSFDFAMERFNSSGLRDKVTQLVIEKQRPLLGICVGMQMLADKSEEGQLPGLGWIEGEVIHFRSLWGDSAQSLPVPHMGWNAVQISDDELSFKLKVQGDMAPQFYFLHSYVFAPKQASSEWMKCQYGSGFSAGVAKANIFGVQFHPEKSHGWGVELLKAFSEVPSA